MRILVYAFPGQGSQQKIDRKLYDNCTIFRDIVDKAKDQLYEIDRGLGVNSRNLVDLILSGEKSTLDLTLNAQPALFVTSFALYRALTELVGQIPNYLMGHSLGECTAVAASGMGLEKMLEFVCYRAKEMSDFVGSLGELQKGEAYMAVVKMPLYDRVEKLCKQITDKKDSEESLGEVYVSNDNIRNQLLISGHPIAVKAACALINAENVGEAKIYSRAKAVSHIPLLSNIATKLKEKLEEIYFTPSIPIISNYAAKPTKDTDEVKENLANQVSNMLRWRESIKWLFENHKDDEIIFVEIGTGTVLTGILEEERKNYTVNLTTYNVNDEASLLRVANILNS
jgi:[acyl-carrier-protein] S-malonyltransferase